MLGSPVSPFQRSHQVVAPFEAFIAGQHDLVEPLVDRMLEQDPVETIKLAGSSLLHTARYLRDYTPLKGHLAWNEQTPELRLGFSDYANILIYNLHCEQQVISGAIYEDPSERKINLLTRARSNNPSRPVRRWGSNSNEIDHQLNYSLFRSTDIGHAFVKFWDAKLLLGIEALRTYHHTKDQISIETFSDANETLGRLTSLELVSKAPQLKMMTQVYDASFILHKSLKALTSRV